MRRGVNATAAGAVAATLRAQIIDGRQPDGSELPRQEDLLDAFGVGVATLRSALRMLEAEGLISVRRGNRGGAVVHTPKPDTIAWTLGLVLQSDRIELHDLATALSVMDPLCAGYCAARPDRATAVLPTLRRLHDESAEVLGDPVEFTRATRRFHSAVSALCGNRTLGLLTGAVESLWAEQVVRWASRAERDNEIPHDRRMVALDQHRDLIAAIDAGDVTRANALATSHACESSDFWLEERGNRPVTVTDLGPSRQ